jgi:phage/conjugal plasmid C-4 type zinc finger TraR family protein
LRGTQPIKVFCFFFSKKKTFLPLNFRSATMANGWAPDGAVQDQIDDTIKDAVMGARARLPTGEGGTHCVECGDEIPPARRAAVPGARTCVPCQSALDRRPVHAGFNRKGNKESQLK